MIPRTRSPMLLVLLLLPLFSCAMPSGSRDYRREMRLFVEELSSWSKTRAPGFLIIPQNGQELFTLDGEPEGTAVESYLAAIDGTGREDLYYGWDEDGAATPAAETEWMESFLDLAEDRGIEALVADYVDTASPMGDEGKTRADAAQAKASGKGYIEFPAPSRGLEAIPAYPESPYGYSIDDVAGLEDAVNFLYLIDPGTYAAKDDFLDALSETDYDILLIDAYWDGTDKFTQLEIEELKTKSSGGKRLVIAYVSIGEAEDYRSYWKNAWSSAPPSWLAEENPDWPGNYKVRYWIPEWQSIVFGTSGSIMDYVVDAGFDGVYLDIIDAFEYFE